MRRISEDVYDLLMRQGISAGSLAGDDAHGIGAGDQSGGTDRLLTARAGGNREPMGMGLKRTPTEAGASSQEVRHDRGGQVRKLGLVLRVFTNPNMSGMPMRQGAVRRAPSLMCIQGGRR